MKTILSISLALVISNCACSQWAHFNPGTTGYISDMSFVDDQVGYTVANTYLWRTVNGGTSWNMILNDSPV